MGKPTFTRRDSHGTAPFPSRHPFPASQRVLVTIHGESHANTYCNPNERRNRKSFVKHCQGFYVVGLVDGMGGCEHELGDMYG